MTGKHYATYEEVHKHGSHYEIAMFSSKKERDEWLDYKDEFCVMTNTTAENSVFTRIPLDNSEAEELLKNCSSYIKDDFLDNVIWAVVPHQKGGDAI